MRGVKSHASSIIVRNMLGEKVEKAINIPGACVLLAPHDRSGQVAASIVDSEVNGLTLINTKDWTIKQTLRGSLVAAMLPLADTLVVSVIEGDIVHEGMDELHSRIVVLDLVDLTIKSNYPIPYPVGGLLPAGAEGALLALSHNAIRLLGEFGLKENAKLHLQKGNSMCSHELGTVVGCKGEVLLIRVEDAKKE